MSKPGFPAPGFFAAARQHLAVGASLVAIIANLGAPIPVAAQDHQARTSSPIQHVIVIIGENRTFDHIFATYQPRHGSIFNLLSEGIINANGTPGPNYSRALQFPKPPTPVSTTTPLRASRPTPTIRQS